MKIKQNKATANSKCERPGYLANLTASPSPLWSPAVVPPPYFVRGHTWATCSTDLATADGVPTIFHLRKTKSRFRRSV